MGAYAWDGRVSPEMFARLRAHPDHKWYHALKRLDPGPDGRPGECCTADVAPGARPAPPVAVPASPATVPPSAMPREPQRRYAPVVTQHRTLAHLLIVLPGIALVCALRLLSARCMWGP